MLFKSSLFQDMNVSSHIHRIGPLVMKPIDEWQKGDWTFLFYYGLVMTVGYACSSISEMIFGGVIQYLTVMDSGVAEQIISVSLVLAISTMVLLARLLMPLLMVYFKPGSLQVFLLAASIF